jgi:hypothetical protein
MYESVNNGTKILTKVFSYPKSQQRWLFLNPRGEGTPYPIRPTVLPKSRMTKPPLGEIGGEH